MQPLFLGVNIDHIATVREARKGRSPDPLFAALLCEQAGADGITLHLREDRRHIQLHDVERIKASLQTRMNLEMAVNNEMMAIAERILPEYCCFVPEKREEVTTEGGLDVAKDLSKIKDACSQLQSLGIGVSLFIDPSAKQIEASIAAGADAIEIHTGEYANALHSGARQEALSKIENAVSLASRTGLVINAGHGLNYQNVQAIARMSEINELNIGHAIVARALMEGLPKAVSDMKQLMQDARR